MSTSYAHSSDAPNHACLMCAAEPAETSCSVAASRGHLVCLQVFHEAGFPWDGVTRRRAAVGGHRDCQAYAHENGCEWDSLVSSVCAMAARSGNLDCLTYANEHGAPKDATTTRLAASRGRLDCLVYAHTHGFEWHGFTCDCAASGGFLACLAYAHENGAPWSEETCRKALDYGSKDCLVYALSRGCPWDLSSPLLRRTMTIFVHWQTVRRAWRLLLLTRRWLYTWVAEGKQYASENGDGRKRDRDAYEADA